MKVRFSQIGVVGEDFRLRDSIRQQVQDIGHADPSSADMWASSADCCVDVYALLRLIAHAKTLA